MRCLIAGHIHIETTLRVDGFPIEYSSVRYTLHAIHSAVSGVAVNVASALSALGAEVDLLSVIGGDETEPWIRARLAAIPCSGAHALPLLYESFPSLDQLEGLLRVD